MPTNETEPQQPEPPVPKIEVPSSLPMIPTREQMKAMSEMAIQYSKASGISPHVAISKMLFGREAGIPPMMSLSGIDIIEGKPCINAQMMVSLVRRRKLGDIKVLSVTEEGVTIEFVRHDNSHAGTVSFTMDDARRAELVGPGSKKLNWKRWPRSMMVARATSMTCKWHFQDALGGIAYTPDELGAETDEDGNMIDIPVVQSNSIVVKRPVTAESLAQDAQRSMDTVVQEAAGKTETVEVIPPSPENVERITPEAAAPPSDMTREKIRSLAARMKIAPSDFGSIVARFKKSGVGEKASDAELAAIASYLTIVDYNRFLAEKLGVNGNAWQAVIEKRGVKKDTDFTVAQADELNKKLLKEVSPFDAQAYFKDRPNEVKPGEQGTLGNG